MKLVISARVKLVAGAMAILLLLAAPAQAYWTKYKEGTVNASSCTSWTVPYTTSYSIGQMVTHAPGGMDYPYYNNTWTQRGYYGPGGKWWVGADSQTALLETTRTYGTCRNP